MSGGANRLCRLLGASLAHPRQGQPLDSDPVGIARRHYPGLSDPMDCHGAGHRPGPAHLPNVSHGDAGVGLRLGVVGQRTVPGVGVGRSGSGDASAGSPHPHPLHQAGPCPGAICQPGGTVRRHAPQRRLRRRSPAGISPGRQPGAARGRAGPLPLLARDPAHRPRPDGPHPTRGCGGRFSDVYRRLAHSPS
jgi:hypothetical protein